jgi:hypothetical protein
MLLYSRSQRTLHREIPSERFALLRQIAPRQTSREV